MDLALPEEMAELVFNLLLLELRPIMQAVAVGLPFQDLAVRRVLVGQVVAGMVLLVHPEGTERPILAGAAAAQAERVRGQLSTLAEQAVPAL
jgi:hypothetical protein